MPKMTRAARTIKTTETEQIKTIKIPPIEFRTIRVTLDGISPLLVNKFSEKAKTEMAEKHSKKAKNKKGARDPVAEYKASLYLMPGKKTEYGMPTSGIKNCAVSSCRFIEGFPMTLARGAFHVLDDGSGLIKINNGKPVMDERIVRIGGFKKVAMTRYRGRFDTWSVTFDIRYNSGVISAEQLLNLYENAGFSVGLCEFRPEKNGSYGMFNVRRSK